MKILPFVIVVCLTSGCIGEGSKPTSKLRLNVDSINFCDRALGDAYAWNDLQLRNTGKGPLVVKSVQLRGDAGCAFECAYATDKGIASCTREKAGAGGPAVSIAKGDTLLLRVVYTPSAEDRLDKATLVVTTDADNIGSGGDAEWHQLLVPMCGRGVTVTADTGGDAGVSTDGDAGASDALDAGAAEHCADCGKPLEKGAASCENG